MINPKICLYLGASNSVMISFLSPTWSLKFLLTKCIIEVAWIYIYDISKSSFRWQFYLLICTSLTTIVFPHAPSVKRYLSNTELRIFEFQYHRLSIYRCRTLHDNERKTTGRTLKLGSDLEVIRHLGAVSIRKTVLPGMAIPMLKIRRPNGRLIFNMEIAIRR